MARLFLLVLTMLALAAGPASAHRLALFAATTGAEISGKAYFAGGSPARGISIRATGPDNVLLAETTTAEDGTFTLTATERVDHLLTADSGDGHVAKFTIPARELPESLPGGPEDPARESRPSERPSTNPTSGPSGPDDLDQRIETAVDTAVARQLLPLREQLAGFEDQIRLRDVIGGIGYIVGIAGLLAWFGARRKIGGK